MKYLLTGGAGFIGSHLNDYLLAKDHETVIIDNMSTGSFANLIIPPVPDPGPHIIADTVLNKDLLDDIISGVDYIFHLAAVVGVKQVLDNQVRTIETNVEGTSNVLKVAAKYKKPVMIFSTSEVYGKSTTEKLSEDDNLSMGSVYKNRWSYAASKILDEYLAMAYHNEKKLPVTIIRLFNVVGPRQTGRYGMVLPCFVQQALEGKPIIVHGDGQQIRTFTHIKDVVEIIYRLATNKDGSEQGTVFNIGSEQTVKIRSLAHLVKSLLNSKSRIEYIPYSSVYGDGFEDTQSRVPDVAFTQAFTGYKTKQNLETMIYDVAKDYTKYSIKRG